MENNVEIYFVDYGTSKVYYTVREDNTVFTRGKMITLSRDKFLNYLATARVLGYNTGKL